MSLYVAAYDISSSDRRDKVSRILLRQGSRIQESVFELWLEPDELEALRVHLAAVLDPRDAFDLYPIDERGTRQRFRWQRPPDPGGTVIHA